VRACDRFRAGQAAQGWRPASGLEQVHPFLLDDGVVTVPGLGLDQLERGIGEGGVVAPAGEQLVLAVARLAVQVPADDQPRRYRLAFPGGERGVRDLGGLCAGDPPPLVLIPDRPGVLTGVQASSLIPAIAPRILLSIGAVTEENAPPRRIAAITLPA
jgi:hypothetical protein